MASLVAQDSALVKCRKHHEMECFFVNTIRRSPYTTIGYSLVIGDGPQLPATAARRGGQSRSISARKTLGLLEFWTPVAWGNDNFVAPKETGVQRIGARTQQSNGHGNDNRHEGRRRPFRQIPGRRREPVQRDSRAANRH